MRGFYQRLVDMSKMLPADAAPKRFVVDGLVQRHERLPLAATRSRLRGPLWELQPMFRPRLFEAVKQLTTVL